MSAKIVGREKFLKQLDAIPAAVREEVSRALTVSAEEINDVQRRMVPRDSGALAASIGFAKGDAPEGASVKHTGNKMVADAGLAVTLFAGNKTAYYAAMVEFGVQPHSIQPKNGKVLATNGKILGSSVSHPGADPQPFFYPGFRLGKKRAKSRISRAITKGIRRAVR